MKCDCCDEKIKVNECLVCKQKFKKGNKVYCFYNEHFCSKDCVWSYIENSQEFYGEVAIVE